MHEKYPQSKLLKMSIETEKVNTSWENLLQIFKYSRSSNKYQIQDYRKKRNFLEFIKTQTLDPDSKMPKTKISFKTQEVFQSYFQPFLKKKEIEPQPDQETPDIPENDPTLEENSEIESLQARLKEIEEDQRIWGVDLIAIRKFERKSRRKLKKFPHNSNAVIFLKRIKPQEPKKSQDKSKKKSSRSRSRKKKAPEPVKQKEEWEISSESDCFWIDLEETEPEDPQEQTDPRPAKYKEPVTGTHYSSKRDGWQIALDNYKKVKKEIVSRIEMNRELKKILEDEKVQKKKRRKVNRRKDKKKTSETKETPDQVKGEKAKQQNTDTKNPTNSVTTENKKKLIVKDLPVIKEIVNPKEENSNVAKPNLKDKQLKKEENTEIKEEKIITAILPTENNPQKLESQQKQEDKTVQNSKIKEEESIKNSEMASNIKNMENDQITN